MTEKRYLKWYNKVGYGSGDIAGNVVYAFLSSFVMIYLTNTVGLNPGIVGTLIAVSKLLDGVTDIFFGSLIDKTHSKMGKARPWMLYGYIGCAITLVAIFVIPTSLGQFAQYAWFLIAHTLLNAVFYTANNIAYSALTALVTKNSAEQVEMGSYRFMFAFATSLLIQSITLGAVSALWAAVLPAGAPWPSSMPSSVWQSTLCPFSPSRSCRKVNWLTQTTKRKSSRTKNTIWCRLQNFSPATNTI